MPENGEKCPELFPETQINILELLLLSEQKSRKPKNVVFTIIENIKKQNKNKTANIPILEAGTGEFTAFYT